MTRDSAKARDREQFERARRDAKYALAPIKVLRCACGRGVNTELEQGTVECACGAEYDVNSRGRIVATVPPARRQKR